MVVKVSSQQQVHFILKQTLPEQISINHSDTYMCVAFLLRNKASVCFAINAINVKHQQLEMSALAVTNTALIHVKKQHLAVRLISMR